MIAAAITLPGCEGEGAAVGRWTKASAVAAGLLVVASAPAVAGAQEAPKALIPGAVLGDAQQAGGDSLAFGYGSLGTESLMTVLSATLTEAWVITSITLPSVTGLASFPGSTGSYADTPWFSVGELSVSSTDSLSGSVG